MQPNPEPKQRRDILLLIFGLISIAVLAGRGIIQIGTGIFNYKYSVSVSSANFLDGTGMFFCAALLLPLIIYTIRKLRGQETRLATLPPAKLWQVGILTFFWLFVIFLGSMLDNLLKDGRLLALPFYLLGIAMPVAGLGWIAVGGLPAGSWRRLWAAFDIGMTGSTFGAMLLEYASVGVAALAAGILAASNPDWLTIFQQIENQITNGGDIQNLLTALSPYLTNPLILLLALAFASVLAPIIEETLKPTAVWMLGKRLQSPAEGFTLGALCGAGFALLEGTLAASISFQMLGIGIAARATSSLMHITTSGLMGWGIASARLEKRYGRLAGTYLLSIIIHGLWNGSVVLAIFGALRLSLLGVATDLPGMLLVLAGIGIMAFMFAAIVIILPVINHRLRRMDPVVETPLQSVIIAPPQP